MKLEDIIDKRHINITRLAELIGYSRNHLQGVIIGRYRAGKKLLKALENISPDMLKTEKPNKIVCAEPLKNSLQDAVEYVKQMNRDVE